MISVLFIYLLSLSWMKWGNLIIDSFRDINLPVDILRGKILYKDIVYPYGFLPPYLLSAFYFVFGVNILSAILLGIVITVAIIVFIYKISRFFLTQAQAALTVITFLFIFAFGFYASTGIFNFILPYSFASTLFSLFTTGALYFFIAFIFTENNKKLLLFSLFIFLSILSRPDMSIFVWFGFLFSGIVAATMDKRVNAGRLALYIFLPVLFGFLSYLLFLKLNNAYAGFKESIIDCILINASNKLGVSFAGLDHILQNSWYIFQSCFYHLVAVTFLCLASFILSRPDCSDKNDNFSVSVGIIVIFTLFMPTTQYFNPGIQYRCFPVILVAGIIAFFIRTMRRIDLKRNISLLALFVVALLMMVRVILNATPFHYGFYSLILGLICYYVFFFDLCGKYFKSALKLTDDNFSLYLFIFFTFSIITSWMISAFSYSTNNVFIPDKRGGFSSRFSIETMAFWSTVEYLKDNSSRDDTVAVLPEGVGINFFADRKTSLRYYTFLPQDVKAVGEDNMLSQLEKAHVTYVVITARDTAEYGYHAFGKDYAQKLYAWILSNYTLVQQFGPYPFTAPEFGIAIFKHK